MAGTLLTATRYTGQKPLHDSHAASLTAVCVASLLANLTVIRRGRPRHAVFAVGRTNAFAAPFHNRPSAFARAASSFFTAGATIGGNGVIAGIAALISSAVVYASIAVRHSSTWVVSCALRSLICPSAARPRSKRSARKSPLFAIGGTLNGAQFAGFLPIQRSVGLKSSTRSLPAM